MPSLPPPAEQGYLLPQKYCAESIYERFWAKVDVRDPSECWPWVGCISTKSNYGRFGAGWVLGGPQTWIAPRVAYVLAIGTIPTGAEIDHVCHTRDKSCVTGGSCPHRRCVNPAHLEPVTHLENALRREVRRDRTTFSCGHPRSGNTARAGATSLGRCALCHRMAQRAYRAQKRGDA